MTCKSFRLKGFYLNFPEIEGGVIKRPFCIHSSRNQSLHLLNWVSWLNWHSGRMCSSTLLCSDDGYVTGSSFQLLAGFFLSSCADGCLGGLRQSVLILFSPSLQSHSLGRIGPRLRSIKKRLRWYEVDGGINKRLKGVKVSIFYFVTRQRIFTDSEAEILIYTSNQYIEWGTDQNLYCMVTKRYVRRECELSGCFVTQDLFNWGVEVFVNVCHWGARLVQLLIAADLLDEAVGGSVWSCRLQSHSVGELNGGKSK